MSFNDLQLKASAEQACMTAHAGLAKLSLFAKNYSELEGQYGNAVAVPIYTLAAATAWDDTPGSINNYGTSTAGEISGDLVTLDQHYVKSLTITDKQQAETGIQWIKDATQALTESITRGMNINVFSRMNDTTFSATPTEINFSTKASIAQLYATAASADIPVDRSVVVLKPAQFAKVLGQLDSSVYGGTEAIRTGVIPGLFGFKGFVCSGNLPNCASNAIGAIICDSAIGIGSRYLAPDPNEYSNSWKGTTEDGFTIGFRRYTNRDLGADKLACDVLFGVKFFDMSKIIRVKEAAG